LQRARSPHPGQQHVRRFHQQPPQQIIALFGDPSPIVYLPRLVHRRHQSHIVRYLFGRPEADFLINISNEGWFRSASEFDQMLAISVFRAVETRRTLFRATNTGISCMIGPAGGVPSMEDRVTKHGEDKNVEGVLMKRVPLCRNSTVYVRFGDGFANAVFLLQIILLLCLLFKFLWSKKVASIRSDG